jgi:uncharacterized repeat protein (TIGR03843 family)
MSGEGGPLVSAAEVEQVLAHGTVEIVGRMVDASNATLKAVAELDGLTLDCIYKPRDGERPLWDFATGTLGRREVATFEISRALGWDLVPVTVWRDDGPFGAGMCQLWFDADDDRAMVDVVPVSAGEARQFSNAGWHTIIEANDGYGRRVRLVHAEHPELRRLALFDLLVNNADRKGGHILVREVDARLVVVGIDHGLCLHEEDKLRTVLWGWAGDPIDAEHLGGLGHLDLDGGAMESLTVSLTRRELRALARRRDRLIAEAVYPVPDGDWPPLPWPVL